MFELELNNSSFELSLDSSINQYVDPLQIPTFPSNNLLNPQTIAFVDPNVPDAMSLMASLDVDVKIFLDPSRDSVYQITETLSYYQGLKSVIIISHGNIAQLQLGSSYVNNSSLEQYQNEFQQWKSFLDQGYFILKRDLSNSKPCPALR